jgi:hypothetical protein
VIVAMAGPLLFELFGGLEINPGCAAHEHIPLRRPAREVGSAEGAPRSSFAERRWPNPNRCFPCKAAIRLAVHSG